MFETEGVDQILTGFVYLSEVVMYVECGQLGEMSIKAEGHKEACIFISQLRALWLVVGDPGWVHLK